MGKKRLQANGFWLFAQIRKEMNYDKGSFKDYVEVADSFWKEMTEDQKLYWRGLALGFRKTSLFQNMKTIHKMLQETSEESEVHAPWDTLARIAEINRVKLPIQQADLEDEDDMDSKDSVQEFFCCGKTPFLVEDDLRTQVTPTYFTLEFHQNQTHYYMNQDANTFFMQSQRIRLLWDVFQAIMISSQEISGDRLKGHRLGEQININFLLSRKVYTAVFPLHDADILINPANENQKPQNLWPLRPWLYEVWARPGRWHTYQPLDQIREYFGEKVGMYFAWLGLYTTMLIPLTIVGFICFIFGLAIIGPDPLTTEVCDKDGVGSIIICRACASTTCKFQWLYQSCMYSVVSVVFHNKVTIPYSLVTTLWAILFLELWKRKQNRLACKWDTIDIVYEYEPPRPEYQAMAKHKRRHPITRDWEPYIPARSKIQNIMLSLSTVIFLITLGVAIIAAVIVYKMIMVVYFYDWHVPLVDVFGSTIIATTSGSLINAVCIILLEQVYERIAYWLTEKEHPRTLTDFETSLMFKMYSFQFLNYYGLLIYLAFIQGNTASTPQESTILTDHCEPIGCTFSVTTQLIVILICKQIWSNTKEIFMPKLMRWWTARKHIEETEENIYTRFEKDYDLPQLNQFSLLPEYLEMVVQYGIVVMFGAAFPLAPLFALINNFAELRIDAWKFVVECRRDIPKRVADIGNWYPILSFVTHLAILVNALIIALTTDLMDRIVYMIGYSPDGGEEGFMSFTLSIFNTSDWGDPRLSYEKGFGNVSQCRYRGYYNPPGHPYEYELSFIWWRVFFAKIAFIVIFQNAVDWIQSLIQYVIPDIPEDVQLHVQRNRYIQKAVATKFEEEQRGRLEEKDPATTTSTSKPTEGDVETPAEDQPVVAEE